MYKNISHIHVTQICGTTAALPTLEGERGAWRPFPQIVPDNERLFPQEETDILETIGVREEWGVCEVVRKEPDITDERDLFGGRGVCEKRGVGGPNSMGLFPQKEPNVVNERGLSDERGVCEKRGVAPPRTPTKNMVSRGQSERGGGGKSAGGSGPRARMPLQQVPQMKMLPLPTGQRLILL